MFPYSHQGLVDFKGEEAPPPRHVTAIVLCVPSKIQWFVTNYSNSCTCLDCTMPIEEFSIYSLDLGLLVTYMYYVPSSPLAVYKSLVSQVMDVDICTQ